MTKIPGQTYLNPLNRVKWQFAIRAKKPKVKLVDGREFTLMYFKDTDNRNKVHFAPAGPRAGLVPNGVFDVDTVLTDEWLSGD